MASARPLLVSRAWVQASVVVFVFGFFVLGLLAYRTYTASPPIPAEVRSDDGTLVFTAEDVHAGQQIFLSRGLMEYGSVFGHGGYLGPDYTADYLRRAAVIVNRYHGAAEDDEDPRTVREFRENRYDPGTGVLRITDAQRRAFEEIRAHHQEVFSRTDASTGLRPRAIGDPLDVRRLTAFFAWSAWAAAAQRPGKPYSYTNNWPPEPRVHNVPTAPMVLWSMLSLAALLGGIGVLFAAFGRYDFLGWRGRDQAQITFRRPGEVALTPAQHACAWFFLAMAALFLVQAVLGGATQHYRAEIGNFFGLDLARFLPYNLARTWHVQLAIFWVATAFLAAGIFLAPLVARREPKHQDVLAYALLGALVVVVVGSLVGEFLGIHGLTASAWLGNQGFEYLDLGRLWQVLLVAGLVFWVVLLYRALRSRLREEPLGNTPWLFFFSALAIPAFYAVGLLAEPRSHFTVTDFWRFWVVHLWVEDFLELFTTVMVAYVFVLLGVVAERVALAVIYLDILLYSVGGVIGTMHHVYFSGEPAEHMALGAFFSAAEVIPLTFLTVEAWSFLQLGERHTKAAAFPHRWAILFLVAVGFWNFLGAGVFGFLINLPIVSYFEVGTILTPNHGHAALMGVFGMFAISFMVFAIRQILPDEEWRHVEKYVRVSFWGLNIGLAGMVVLNLFPGGLLQFFDVLKNGYWHARGPEFLNARTTILIEWMRLPADAVFILLGVVPLVIAAGRAYLFVKKSKTR